MAREGNEPIALVEVLRSRMFGVHFQIDRATASLSGGLHRSSKQCTTESALPSFWNDEEFVQPGHQSAVLQGPGERQDRHPDRFGVVAEQDGASPDVGKQAHDRSRQRLEAQIDAVLSKLSAEESDHHVDVACLGHLDAHDGMVRVPRPSVSRA